MLQPDQLIHNRYQIKSAIGQGGMGSVYRAIDTRLNKTVALKQTIASDEKMLQAFKSEAYILAGLTHSALPAVTDYFAERGSQFLIMDYIEGDDLQTILDKRGAPLPLDTVLQWTNSLLDVLAYLHSQQPPVIHRDIKPQNIKLTPSNQLFLLDFGLAKGKEKTIISGFSFHYASPEQMQRRSTDPRTDIYSLSVTLHHLLTNTAPIGCMTRLASLAIQKGDPQQPVHVLNQQIPQPISNVIARAMEIEPNDRYATVFEMRQALQGATTSNGVYEGNTIVTQSRPQPFNQPISTPSLPDDRTLLAGSIGGINGGATSTTPPASGQTSSPSQGRGWLPFLLLGMLVLLTLVGLGGMGYYFATVNSTDPTSAPLPPTDIVADTPAATEDVPDDTPVGPTEAPAIAIPALSNQIVFVSDRDGETALHMMNPDGSAVEPLGDVIGVANPAIAPDGTQIAFEYASDIYIMNADGSGLTNLTVDGSRGSYPTWSSDSSQIAFVANNQVQIANVGGANTNARSVLVAATGNYRDLDWSPVADELLFELDGDIYRYTFATNQQTNLTATPESREQEPVWSSDGTQIAFASDRDGGDLDIFVMDAEGNTITSLIDDGDDQATERSPTWSPDDSQIAFRSNRGSGRDRDQDIYVMDADGTNQTNLTNDTATDDTAPVWSP